MTKTENSFVCPIMKGQLGNQLFICSTTLAYAWDYNAEALFYNLNRKENRTSYNKDRLFFRLKTVHPDRRFKHIFKEKVWYSSERIPFLEDIVIEGYFQSWKHFHHHREKILETFEPSQFTKNYIHNTYQHLLYRSDTVAVHVRTADHVVHESSIPFLGEEYFINAMNLFPDHYHFVFFSDRINWCKNRFMKLKKNITFIEGNYAIEDMFLMAKCKHQIIGNSTFGWWAAYLTKDSEKKVVAPERWIAEFEHPCPKQDLYLQGWLTVPFTKQPYPEDMYFYDQESLSDDNNVART